MRIRTADNRVIEVLLDVETDPPQLRGEQFTCVIQSGENIIQAITRMGAARLTYSRLMAESYDENSYQ